MQQNYFDYEKFKVLGDESRIEILEALGSREMNVTEIAQKCSVLRPTVSHHLQVMKRANIVSSRKEGKEIYYSVNKQDLTSLAAGILNFISRG